MVRERSVLGNPQGRLVQLSTIMNARGFTLIELLIAVTIFGFLIMLAGPMYTEFMGNAQIRNGAEAMLNGVRLAQSKALGFNLPTILTFDAANGWTVSTDDPDNPGTPLFTETYSFKDGAKQVTVAPTPGAGTEITFDGLGRLVGNTDGATTITAFDITNTTSGTRPLRVVVSNTAKATGTKLCDPDPAIAANDPTDPRICP